MRIVTAGVYGFTEDAFFSALEKARVDVFVDTRRRRAVRGSRYAFANSKRLQQKLADHNIGYVHDLKLAPPMDLVRSQDDVDRSNHIRRSDREHLSEEFVERYNQEVLSDFDSEEFVHSLGLDATTVLIFCVEKTPEACHRSLVAQRLAEVLGLEVEHIVP